MGTSTILDEVVVLGGPCAVELDASALGGKAAALRTMIEAGLPVPDTAVVTTAAYERVIGADDRLAVFGSGSIDASDDDVDRAFIGAVPNALRREILDARRTVAGEGPVVVRSSATAEDLGDASYAGQYQSVIGPVTDDEVIAAVERVWASLSHRAPLAYRRLGLPDDAASMAVIIQPLIPASTAGIVFTVDPLDHEHVRIEHVVGLGDALAAGAVTPDVVRLTRDRLGAAPSLTIADAARSALDAEVLFGGPQDVEWAADDRGVWLVQSRPITTERPIGDPVDGFDTEVDAERRYTTAGVAEMLPGVIPALHWATVGFMVDHAFAQVIDQLGGLPDDLHEHRRFVIRTRGRAALDLDHLSAVADRLPGGSPADLEEQFFGATPAHPSTTSDAAPSRWASTRHDIRVLRANRGARAEQVVTTNAIASLVDAWTDVGTATDDELLALRARLVDLGCRATTAELAVAAAAVAAFRRLEDRLQRYLGAADGSAWAMRATRSLRPDTVVQHVARVAANVRAADPELLDLEVWDDAQLALRDRGRDDLVDAVVAAAFRDGSRRLVGGPTWCEDLDRYWRLIRSAHALAPARTSGANELAALERTLVAQPGWSRHRWLTGQIIDTRRYVIRRLTRDAIDLLQRRETAKSALLTLGGLIRTVDLELGRRLEVRGRLVVAGDVAHLSPFELAQLVNGRAVVTPEAVLARRRCVERWAAEDELPLTFRGRPAAAVPAPPAGDRLQGWAASAGRHTGPVRWLTAPDDRAVRPGDVVVARRTDASWSPVFLRAAAIVVEEGGPLSHAAIVARELGLPAVVNVPGAVARLRQETAPVTVDGDAGLVVVHADPQPVATAEERS